MFAAVRFAASVGGLAREALSTALLRRMAGADKPVGRQFGL